MIKEIQDIITMNVWNLKVELITLRLILGKKYWNKHQQFISQKQKNRNYSPIRIMGRRVNTNLTTIWISKAINRVRFFCKNNKEERKKNKFWTPVNTLIVCKYTITFTFLSKLLEADLSKKKIKIWFKTIKAIKDIQH